MIDLLPASGARRERLLITDQRAAVGMNALVGRVPGVSYSKEGLTLPVDPRLFELAVKTFKPPVSEGAKRWYLSLHHREVQLAQLLAAEDADIPNYSKASVLRPYQRVAINYIVEAKRALLCDEMGLGKGVTSIAAVDVTQGKNVLIVCPRSLQHNWRDEIERWSTQGLPITLFESATRKKQWEEFKGGWAIVNYEQLRLDADIVTTNSGYKVRMPNRLMAFGTWDWLILDEAHRAKSKDTQTFALLKSLKFRNALCVTGTPYGNNPAEIWTLLNILWPEHYSSYWRFFELYVSYSDTPFGRDIHGPKNVDLLRKDLATRMIRRTKEQVAKHIPPKTYQEIVVKPHQIQTQLYKKLIKEFFVEHKDVTITVSNVLSLTMRLRQLLSTPACLGMEDVSAKLDAAVETILGTDESVLVFSLFKSTVYCLRDRLQKEGVSCGVITGDVSAEERHTAVEDFSSGKTRVLASTVTSGGVGLNLMQATLVIFVDKHWNPVVQQQAEDRAHRLLQTKPVHIVSLVCPNTIDDRVEAVLNKKISMQEALQAQSLLQEFKSFLR